RRVAAAWAHLGARRSSAMKEHRLRRVSAKRDQQWCSYLRDTTLASGFGFDPTDVAVLALENDIEPFGLRVPKNQKVAVRSADLNGGIINTHRLGRDLIRADDPGQLFAQSFFNLEDGRRCNYLPALVIAVVPL